MFDHIPKNTFFESLIAFGLCGIFKKRYHFIRDNERELLQKSNSRSNTTISQSLLPPFDSIFLSHELSLTFLYDISFELFDITNNFTLVHKSNPNAFFSKKLFFHKNEYYRRVSFFASRYLGVIVN